MPSVRIPGSPGLLERDGELGLIAAVVARVRGGEGALLVVEGQAGVGKTELLRAAADLGEAQGLRVLRTRGSELDRAFAFGVVRQLLERVVAEEPELLTAGRRPPRACSPQARTTRAPRRASFPLCRDCTGSSSTSRRAGH